MNEIPPERNKTTKTVLVIVSTIFAVLIVGCVTCAGVVFLFGERVTHLVPECADELDPEACDACCSENVFGYSRIEERDGVPQCACAQR